MFRKLVSNLPFSPALVGQIGFYARRLRKEEMTRRLGLFMTVLALVVQSFTVLVPSTSANGTDSNDMCPGITRDAAGIKKIKDCYTNNTRNYRDIMTAFGIGKDELWKALDNSGSWRYTTSYGEWYTFGHVSRSVDVKDYSGRVPGNLYARKWKNTVITRQWGWVGQSGQTEFVILADCGNLALKRLLNPSAKCISLIASKQDLIVNEPITLTAKASADDGAELAQYSFSQDGPGTSDASTTVKTNKDIATWQRTLTVAGKYTFKVDVSTTNSSDSVAPRTCTEEVNVRTPEVKNPHVNIEKYVLSTSDPSNLLETMSVPLNGTFMYRIVVHNDGQVELKNVVVSDTAKDGIQFVSARDATNNTTVSVTGNKIGYQIASMPVGKTIVIDITAKSTKVAVSQVVNTACVETPTIASSNPDDCNTASTVTPEENKVVVCDPTTGLTKQVPVSEKDKYPAANSAACISNIDIVKTAFNNTQGKDASTVKANGGDTITFTITATNISKAGGDVTIDDNLTDALEYASLTELGGGTYNRDSKVLSWASARIAGSSKITRTFSMKVLNPIPSMAQNNGTPESYDCVISNVASKDGKGLVRVPVTCPVQKEIVEQTVVKNLPSTGPTENMLFAGALLAVVSFFWARSRQLGKEVRLVRKEFSASTI